MLWPIADDTFNSNLHVDDHGRYLGGPRVARAFLHAFRLLPAAVCTRLAQHWRAQPTKPRFEIAPVDWRRVVDGTPDGAYMGCCDPKGVTIDPAAVAGGHVGLVSVAVHELLHMDQFARNAMPKRGIDQEREVENAMRALGVPLTEEAFRGVDVDLLRVPVPGSASSNAADNLSDRDARERAEARLDAAADGPAPSLTALERAGRLVVLQQSDIYLDERDDKPQSRKRPRQRAAASRHGQPRPRVEVRALAGRNYA